MKAKKDIKQQLFENRLLKKDQKTLLFENMIKLNPDLKLTPKGRLRVKRTLNESGAFNDAGEPLMTHQQYNAYSEPSEPDYDSDEYRNAPDREQNFNDVVKSLEKHFDTILDHYGSAEYTFLTTRETPGDMMVWSNNNQIGAIGPDDKEFPEQHIEELDINELIQFFEPYRQYIITGQEAAKEMNDRSRQASADRNYERQERAAMGGLGEGWTDDEDDTEAKSSFRSRERNAGVEPEDRNQIKKDMNNYVKVGKTFMKSIYYKPYLGPTDGKLYTKKGDEYV